MSAFIIRRLLGSIIVLLCVMTLTFVLIRLHGSPFEKEKMTEQAKLAKEAQYGLDGPVLSQLGRYMEKLFLKGSANVSIRYKDAPVVEILAAKMPNSIRLGTFAFLLASLGGIACGFIAAMRRDSWLDVSTMFLALGAISIPTFVTGPLFVAVFALWLGWLPVGGLDGFQSLLLPGTCLALPFLAYVARLTRNSLLDVMSSNYMRTAKAKGLSDASALARHALKVAILPVITYLGPMAAYVLTGSFVIESVFNISGAGGVFVNAIQNDDPFLLTGAVIIYSALILFFNFIVDVTYTFLDKRIQVHA